MAPPAASRQLDRPLQAIADPVRRRILMLLRQKGRCSLPKPVGLCASDIEAQIRLSQPTVSHHMAILGRAGLIIAKKEGLWMWYRRDEAAIKKLTRALHDEL